MEKGREKERRKDKRKLGNMMAKHSPEFQHVKFNFFYTYFIFSKQNKREPNLSKVNKFALRSESAS